LQALLDEDGRVHTGLYNPYMDDPDMCNPFATTMWETSLLCTHYNPAVKAINLLILGKNLSSLQRDIQSTNLDVDKLVKSNTIKTEIFELNPKVKLPTQIIAKSKKTRLDGPFTVFESEFLSSLHKI
jgi:nucleolar complex protein 3